MRITSWRLVLRAFPITSVHLFQISPSQSITRSRICFSTKIISPSSMLDKACPLNFLGPQVATLIIHYIQSKQSSDVRTTNNNHLKQSLQCPPASTDSIPPLPPMQHNPKDRSDSLPFAVEYH
ncbi:hypothetical protein AVEN_188394-1 [Araneus ventricosus]|uniref:Uncharacterized protein n=1 Tax=Araneus ventricosus TaxID=182803 RepID=A0A4Y2ECM7_ARAVE|nr:hypothetical protein AVEN_188394-1 [Araneus ventricosus]